MARKRISPLPSTPRDASPTVRRWMEGVKEALEVRLGRRGDPGEAAVTFNDLARGGLLSPGGGGGGGAIGGPAPGGGGDNGGGGLPTYPTPPNPAGAVVQGVFGGIHILWNQPGPQYGIALTEIKRGATADVGGAQMLGAAGGNNYLDVLPGQQEQTFWYWVRHVNLNGVAGPWTSGLEGTKPADTGMILERITGEIDDTHLAQFLSQEIAKISGTLDTRLTTVTDNLASATDRIGKLADGTGDFGDLDQKVIDQRTEVDDGLAMALLGASSFADAGGSYAELRSALVSERDTALAGLLVNYYTSAEVDSAVSGLRTSLIARYEDAQSGVLQEYETTADAEQARSTVRNDLIARYEDVQSGLLQYYETVSDAEQARAAMETAIIARYEDAQTGILQEYETIADADQARAGLVDSVRSSVGGDIAAVERRVTTHIEQGAAWGSNFVTDKDYGRWSGSGIERSTDSFSGSHSIKVSGGGSNPTSGDSTGASARASIPEATSMAFSGRTIKVSFYAKASGSLEFAVAYSTDGDGDSGWQRFVPDSHWQQFSFNYNVPESGLGLPHWVGIWGDTSGAGGSVLIDSVQVSPVTTEEDLPGFMAMYTAKVEANGLVGGFGIYNDGVVVDAGFDVDRFWVGRTDDNKRKPFIIQGGVVYIDEVMIRDASIQEGKLGPITIGKITKADGTPVTTVAGLIRADAVDADNLHVAGATVFSGDVTSNTYSPGQSGWRILQNGDVEFNEGTFNGKVEFTNLSGPKPAVDADKTGDNKARDSDRLAGSWGATIRDRANHANSRVNHWTKPNKTTIDGNKITTGEAYVDTLEIKGQAVTIPVSARSPGDKSFDTSWTSVRRLTFNPRGGRASIIISSGYYAYNSDSAGRSGTASASVEAEARVLVNGSEVYKGNLGSDSEKEKAGSDGGDSASVRAEVGGTFCVTHLTGATSSNQTVDLQFRIVGYHDPGVGTAFDRTITSLTTKR